MISNELRLQDTILIFLYSSFCVSSVTLSDISKWMRDGGADVTYEEVRRQTEILRNKGLVRFAEDYVEPPTWIAPDTPLQITGDGCTAAERVLLRREAHSKPEPQAE